MAMAVGVVFHSMASALGSEGGPSVAGCCRRYDKSRATLLAAADALRRAVRTRALLVRAMAVHSSPFVFDPSSQEEDDDACGDGAHTYGAPIRVPFPPLGTLATLPVPIARMHLAQADEAVHKVVVGIEPLVTALAKEARAVAGAAEALQRALVKATNDAVDNVERLGHVAALQESVADARRVALILTERSREADAAALGLRAGLANAADLPRCLHCVDQLEDAVRGEAEALLLSS
jgi:hypothetical protein